MVLDIKHPANHEGHDSYQGQVWLMTLTVKKKVSLQNVALILYSWMMPKSALHQNLGKWSKSSGATWREMDSLINNLQRGLEMKHNNIFITIPNPIQSSSICKHQLKCKLDSVYIIHIK